MVEIFFGIITRQAIRRCTFTSVGDLTELPPESWRADHAAAVAAAAASS
jgi:hypothetical protein